LALGSGHRNGLQRCAVRPKAPSREPKAGALLPAATYTLPHRFPMQWPSLQLALRARRGRLRRRWPRMGNSVDDGRCRTNKRPDAYRAFCLYYCRQRPTLPHSFPCSTIGGIRLNFRVRNGNGCDPDPMTTGILVGSLGSRRASDRSMRSLQCCCLGFPPSRLRRFGAASLKRPAAT
jgi:hypothetical protein